MSYIIVAANTVKTKCENALTRIELLRARKMGRAVFAEAHKKRWFGEPWGYEKAFAALSDEGYDGAFYSASLTYGAQESKCKALLTLSKNGDPVYISDDAAWILEDK